VRQSIKLKLLLLMSIVLLGCSDPAIWNGNSGFANKITYQDVNYQIGFTKGQTQLTLAQINKLDYIIEANKPIKTIFISESSRLTNNMRMVYDLRGGQKFIIYAHSLLLSFDSQCQTG